MTIRADIIPAEPGEEFGWVQVDPFDYSYNASDTNGEIEAYLSAVGNGEYNYSWGEDDENHPDEYPPELLLIDIANQLRHFDDIFFIDYPDDFSRP